MNILRSFLPVTLALSLFACGLDTSGPPADITVEVRNDYAESLFTVRAIFLDDAGAAQEVVFFNGERIASSRTKTSTVTATPARGSQITFGFSSVSLGETYTFPPMTEDVQRGTYQFVYDYDLATANFAIGHGWKP